VELVAKNALGQPASVVVADAGTNRRREEWFVRAEKDFTKKDVLERAQ